MTAAERMQRYRERKRAGEVGKRDGVTVKQAAQRWDISERSVYYTRAIERYRLIEWPREIYAGKRGNKVSFAFVADICRHADEGIQAAMLDCIRERGAREARAIWEQLKADAEAK